MQLQSELRLPTNSYGLAVLTVLFAKPCALSVCCTFTTLKDQVLALVQAHKAGQVLKHSLQAQGTHTTIQRVFIQFCRPRENAQKATSSNTACGNGPQPLEGDLTLGTLHWEPYIGNGQITAERHHAEESNQKSAKGDTKQRGNQRDKEMTCSHRSQHNHTVSWSPVFGSWSASHLPQPIIYGSSSHHWWPTRIMLPARNCAAALRDDDFS